MCDLSVLTQPHAGAYDVMGVQKHVCVYIPMCQYMDMCDVRYGGMRGGGSAMASCCHENFLAHVAPWQGAPVLDKPLSL